MSQDKFILSVGAHVGGCLVDGLGDGVMVQAPGVEKEGLRSICFGLLQVCVLCICYMFCRNTNNILVSHPLWWIVTIEIGNRTCVKITRLSQYCTVLSAQRPERGLFSSPLQPDGRYRS